MASNWDVTSSKLENYIGTVYVYGDAYTDGSVRLLVNGTGDLVYQKYNAGTQTWAEETVSLSAESIRKIDTIQTTGLLGGGLISATIPGTTVDWTAGVGQVADYSDPENPVVTEVTWPAVSGYTPTNLVTDATTLFGYDKDGNIVETLAYALTAIDTKENIYFGSVTHVSGFIVSINTSPGNLAYDRIGAFKDFFNLVIGPANVNGNIYGPNGVNLNIDVLGGTAYMLGSNFRNDSRVADLIDLPSIAGVTFYRLYREADPALTMTYTGPTIAIDPTQYDDGSGTLQTVTTGYWTIQRIFRGRTGQTFVAYGQQEFSTKALALEALGQEPFEEKMPLPLTLYRCSLVVSQNATDLSDTNQAEFFAQSSFRITGAVSSSATIPGVTSPGGIDRSIQYNNAGNFGGSSNFTFTVPGDYATLKMESLGATGGVDIIFNNSSSLERLALSYSETLNKSIIEAVTNNLTISTQDTLTLEYGACSATFNDTTGNNAFNLISSASTKDVNFNIKNSVGGIVFKVEHNDVSGQTSLDMISDAGSTKFAITYNSTLDDVFLSSGTGASLYINSNDAFYTLSQTSTTIESNTTMTIASLGDYNVKLQNDASIFALTSSTGQHSFSFSNTEPNTEPLIVFAKDHITGGVCRMYVTNTAPETVITASGGALCVYSNGTSSNIYLKIEDATATGWQSLLGDVVGPSSSTDNALALFDGTTGKLLQSSSLITVSEAIDTEIRFKSPSASTGSQIIFESFGGGYLTAFEYDEVGLDTTIFLSGTGHSFKLDANGTVNLRTFSNDSVTINNDNASYTIFGATQSYYHAVTNNQPNTNPLIRYTQTGLNGGTFDLFVSTVAPETVITASGGALCLLDSGTNSDLFIKRTDTGNTGWVDFLHGASGVQGPASSTDNAIATWDGTDGLTLQNTSAFIEYDINDTRLHIDNNSITGQSGLQIRTNAQATRFSIIYNQALEDVFTSTSLGVNYYVESGGQIHLDGASTAQLTTTGNNTVTLSNANASLIIGSTSTGNRLYFQNNRPDTDEIILLNNTGLNGGISQLFLSSRNPEGNITGNGGDICVRSDSINSDIYLKRTEGGNTGWVDLLHAGSGVQGPTTSTDNAIAVWDGTDGLTLQNSYSSIISNANSTILAVNNVSATGVSGYEIKNNLGLTRYSLTYEQTSNAVFMTTNSGTSYSNVVDGSLEELSFSNVAIGSFTNNLVELYNTGATFRIDVSANGNRLYYTNATADTFAMLHLAKLGTNGGTINMFTTSRTPLGNITANGGDIAFRDSGTSSNLYIKRVDGGTTGWNVGITKASESSTVNAISVFDVTTGNSITDVSTAKLIQTAASTEFEIKPVLATGQAEINLRSSASAIKGQLYYQESTNRVALEAVATDFLISNLQGPLIFASSTTDSTLYIRTTTPLNALDGDPGDKAIVVSGNTSSEYINTGSTTDNRVWSKYILDSDTNAFGGFGRLQNRVRWSEDLTQSTWFDSVGNTTIIPGATTGPNGELVDNVQWDSAGLGLRTYSLGTVQGNTYTVSFFAKHISGTNRFISVDINDGGGVGFTVDSNEWQRYRATLVAGSSGSWLDFTHQSTSTFAIWGVQVNDGADLYPYLKTEDIARKDTTDYGLAVAGKINFTGSVIDSDDIITNLVTGVLEGGTLSINGVDDSLIDVTGGRALIVDYSIPGSPNIREIGWDAQTIDPVLGATEFIKWIGVQESSTPGVGEFVFDIEFTQLEKRTIAIVGRCWGDGVTDSITAVGQYTTPATGQAYTANDLSYVLGSMNKRGNVFSANGANLLLNKTAGISYRYSADYLANPTAPHVHADIAQTGITVYWYLKQNSLVAEVQPDIDPDNWDNGGTKTAVPTGKYTLQRLYYYPVSQLLAPTYGQELFDSMGEAIGTAGEDIVEVPDELLEGAILRGWIALKQGATALNDPAQALFKEARSVGDQPAKGVVGSTLTYRNYTVADIGASGIHYYAGFYQAPAASVTLTVGGTATQVYGTANIARGAHAFCVASGPSGLVCVLTVSGTSITDLGVRTTSDSEVIVPNGNSASTNQYFETTKKWLGQVTYTLTGIGGAAFIFNYGFAKYDDFGNRNFTITDFQVTGQGAASETALDIQLMHHKSTGWTYSAGAFVPGTGFIVSLANDYSTDDNLANGIGFAYKRTNLSTFVNGEGSEGLLVKFSTATNNSISSATIEIGALI